MFDKKRVTLAQLTDRMLQRATLTVFLLALTYTVAVGTYFTPTEFAEYLEIIRRILPVISVIVSLPTAIALALYYMKRDDKTQVEPDGFLQDVYTKACMYAFSITFIFMLIYDTVLSKNLLSHLPAYTVVHIILMVAFFSLSFCFYFMSRDSRDSRDEFDEGND